MKDSSDTAVIVVAVCVVIGFFLCTLMCALCFRYLERRDKMVIARPGVLLAADLEN